MQVVGEKRVHHVATLLDTKGPEIRTAMLRGGKDIELKAGRHQILPWVTVLLCSPLLLVWEFVDKEYSMSCAVRGVT